ncbi:hypothetical protein [Sneathiella chinensis]|uniref:Uncharacterized protein n=2 Tax=Sneathiella chinensis TaxID=349750 RepID=A0ABQ5U736_9PROT|nr:hypothetical protein [Sneathiella chinensis]GLQ07023.1 hypothetical protein GCM10007924_22440 [Sneathiella chinensis]
MYLTPNDLKTASDRAIVTREVNYLPHFIVKKISAGYSAEPVLIWLTKVQERRHAPKWPVWDFSRYGGSQMEGQYLPICSGIAEGIRVWARHLADLPMEDLLTKLNSNSLFRRQAMEKLEGKTPVALQEREEWEEWMCNREKCEFFMADAFEQSPDPKAFHFTLDYLEVIGRVLLDVHFRCGNQQATERMTGALKALHELVEAVRNAVVHGEAVEEPEQLSVDEQLRFLKSHRLISENDDEDRIDILLAALKGRLE